MKRTKIRKEFSFQVIRMEINNQLLSHEKAESYILSDFALQKNVLILNKSSECVWKFEKKSQANILHQLCSYMAMFPPSLPRHFIKKYSKEGDKVLDIFSGRGTTILESCLQNRIGIGNDLNPLAFVLTKAKSNVPKKQAIVRRIKELEVEFSKKIDKIDISSEESKIRIIFSDYTLRQLVFLKNNLEWKKNNIDNFITSLLLGIIHGRSLGYLSLSMPNTFSMAPNYIRGFIEKHGLTKPKRNAFDLLIKKLDRCYYRPNVKGKVYRQDARNISRIKSSSIDLIITSPPYTRVIKYGQFNWIRLWFLGEDCKEVDKNLFFSQSLDKYCQFMTEVLFESFRILKPGAKAVLVIGDVKKRENEEIINLAEEVWKRCAEPLGFKRAEPIIEDTISDDTKVTKILGSKRGNATKIDRILVIEKL